MMRASTVSAPIRSACSASSVTYVEDSTAPDLPLLSVTSPVSPSSVNSVSIQGLVEEGAQFPGDPEQFLHRRPEAMGIGRLHRVQDAAQPTSRHRFDLDLLTGDGGAQQEAPGPHLQRHLACIFRHLGGALRRFQHGAADLHPSARLNDIGSSLRLAFHQPTLLRLPFV